MRDLLDKGSLTRLMVLRSLARGPVRTLRRIADEVGVSVQAVSEHLKRLTEAGLVENHETGPRLTREGHEMLAGSLTTLKRFIDTAVRDLARIETTAARAATPVEQGQAVGLFMEDGELVARAQAESPSRGVAMQDAHTGQDVLVGELEGIVNLEPGRVAFLIVPESEAGGSRAVDIPAIRDRLDQAGVVAAQGPVARHVASEAGVEPVRFAAWAVAAEAALVGVDVVVIVERNRLTEFQERYTRACAELGFDAKPRVEPAP